MQFLKRCGARSARLLIHRSPISPDLTPPHLLSSPAPSRALPEALSIFAAHHPIYSSLTHTTHKTYYQALVRCKAWAPLIAAQKERRDRYAADPEGASKPGEYLERELTELLLKEPHRRDGSQVGGVRREVERAVEEGDWERVKAVLKLKESGEEGKIWEGEKVCTVVS